MRFISYIYVSAALLWAAYASPLPNERDADSVHKPEDHTHVRSADIITELDLVAARAQLDAEDTEGLEVRNGGGSNGSGCIVA